MFKKQTFKFQKGQAKGLNPFDWKIEQKRNVTSVFSYNDVLRHIELLKHHLNTKENEIKEILKDVKNTQEEINLYEKQAKEIEKSLKVTKLAEEFNKKNQDAKNK